MAGCSALSEEVDSVAVETEGNVLLSVGVSPMDRPNLNHTHTKIIPFIKGTLAGKN